MDQLFKQIHKELHLHIFPFWNGLIDLKNGGYYGELSSDIVLNKKADKGSLSITRLLWSYSRMFNYSKDESYLKYAEHIYDFLIKKLYDHKNKGSYWSVDYKGNIKDNRKHICAQSYVIYALSEYYKASKNEEIKQIAIELFSLIEQTAYDQKLNGYKEEFTAEWVEKENELLAEEGIHFVFSMNTHLHLLEAYTNLYRIDKNSALKNALIKLLEIITEKIYDHKSRHMQVFFDENWKSKANIHPYGHDIEASWLIQEAIDILEIKDDSIDQIILKLGNNISLKAIMPDGSIINECRERIIDQSRVWWGQSEALVGFMNLYQKTDNPEFKKSVINLWAFISDNIVDSREGAEWHAELDSDLKAKNKPIVQLWKTPYHNVRSCIELLERIKKVSNKSIL